MCHGVPGMRTDTIVGWMVVFFVVTSFWITVIVPESYVVPDKPHQVTITPETTHREPARLAILCLERSGSTWLTAMLNNNNGVNILAEPMHLVATKHKNMDDKNAAASMEYHYLISKLEEVSQNKSLTLVGFNEKLIYPKYILPTQPIAIRNISHYFINNKFRIVFLRRKNVVYQAVSMIRAVQLSSKCGSDGWSKTHEKGWQDVCGKHQAELLQEPIPLHDLKENILRAQQKNVELLKTIKSMKLPYITIYYEDMHDHPEQAMHRISEFINVPLEVKDTLFVKQGDVNLRKTVPNIDEIIRYVSKWDKCLIDHVKYFNPLHSCNSVQRV